MQNLFILLMKEKDQNFEVHFYFNTGNRLRIDTIFINKKGEGADLVNEELLRKITGIESGSYYNQDEIQRSQIRLFRTGLFNSVILTANQNESTVNRINLQLGGSIGNT